MEAKGTSKNLVSVGGLCVATTYALVVIFIFVLTAINTKASNVGYDWIPFVLLSMPWYALNPKMLLPGLVVNAVVMYLLGTLLQAFWSKFIRQRQQAPGQSASNDSLLDR
jgi:hypothetical protein